MKQVVWLVVLLVAAECALAGWDPTVRLTTSDSATYNSMTPVGSWHLPAIVRRVLFLDGDCSRMGAVPKAVLLDLSGRAVMSLRPGANDVNHLASGVYFVRSASGVTKSVLAR